MNEAIVVAGLVVAGLWLTHKKPATPSPTGTNATSGLGGTNTTSTGNATEPKPAASNDYGSNVFGTIFGWLGKVIGASSSGGGTGEGTRGGTGDFGGNSGSTGEGSHSTGVAGTTEGGTGFTPGFSTPGGELIDPWKDPFEEEDED